MDAALALAQLLRALRGGRPRHAVFSRPVLPMSVCSPVFSKARPMFSHDLRKILTGSEKARRCAFARMLLSARASWPIRHNADDSPTHAPGAPTSVFGGPGSSPRRMCPLAARCQWRRCLPQSGENKPTHRHDEDRNPTETKDRGTRFPMCIHRSRHAALPRGAISLSARSSARVARLRVEPSKPKSKIPGIAHHRRPPFQTVRSATNRAACHKDVRQSVAENQDRARVGTSFLAHALGLTSAQDYLKARPQQFTSQVVPRQPCALLRFQILPLAKLPANRRAMRHFGCAPASPILAERPPPAR